jgi:nucleoside-diphosphate-sugar epimerase
VGRRNFDVIGIENDLRAAFFGPEASTRPVTRLNATGTLNVLQAAPKYAPDATFIFASTNQVYGDLPNTLPLVDAELRLELPADHRYHSGIDTSKSMDRSMHSLFGLSKATADLMVQEEGGARPARRPARDLRAQRKPLDGRRRQPIAGALTVNLLFTSHVPVFGGPHTSGSSSPGPLPRLPPSQRVEECARVHLEAYELALGRPLP